LRHLAALLFRHGPETAHPLQVAALPAPEAGDPLPGRRLRTPAAADPQEILALVVPGPVTADPGHVALGLLARPQHPEGRRRAATEGRRSWRATLRPLAAEAMRRVATQDFGQWPPRRRLFRTSTAPSSGAIPNRAPARVPRSSGRGQCGRRSWPSSASWASRP